MKGQKKQQSINIYINSTKIPNVEFDEENKTLKISNIGRLNIPKYDQVKTEIFYERDSGKNKILHLQYFNKNLIDFQFNDGLRNRYNMVFACDTNYKIVDNEKLCVGCLSILAFSKSNFHAFPIKAAVFSTSITENTNPERISWRLFLDYINSDKYKQSKICFFVDSELNKIDEFNMARESIIDDFFLPKNITMSYASADTGKEYIGNQLLLCSDNAATELLNYLINNNFKFPNFKKPRMFSKDLKNP
ncbi:MAG: hypothetical protein PSV16_00435 [Flavobacterium sp.]|nr:hypothetical protein [Flavobacterium sp.]